ncbi:hypothetical protein SNEBB_005040 [Seison nebaliae]|nr:hypothetical protein SNEBB_005040 [Seison nebaliae]
MVINILDSSCEIYLIKVLTGSDNSAGSDASITFTFYGDSGSRSITISGAGALFDRNKFDELQIDTKTPIGTLRAIELNNDGGGFGPDWHLFELHIVDQTNHKNHKIWHCDCVLLVNNAQMHQVEQDIWIDQEESSTILINITSSITTITTTTKITTTTSISTTTTTISTTSTTSTLNIFMNLSTSTEDNSESMKLLNIIQCIKIFFVANNITKINAATQYYCRLNIILLSIIIILGLLFIIITSLLTGLLCKKFSNSQKKNVERSSSIKTINSRPLSTGSQQPLLSQSKRSYKQNKPIFKVPLSQSTSIVNCPPEKHLVKTQSIQSTSKISFNLEDRTSDDDCSSQFTDPRRGRYNYNTKRRKVKLTDYDENFFKKTFIK